MARAAAMICRAFHTLKRILTMQFRQSPSGPFITFLALIAIDQAIQGNSGGGGPDTFTAGAPPAPLTLDGVEPMLVSYTAAAGKQYTEDVVGNVNAANVAAVGTDTWLSVVQRRETPAGGAPGPWDPCSQGITRETETANASQGTTLVGDTPRTFAPTVETLVEFRIVVEAASSDAVVLQRQASLDLKVYQ